MTTRPAVGVNVFIVNEKCTHNNAHIDIPRCVLFRLAPSMLICRLPTVSGKIFRAPYITLSRSSSCGPVGNILPIVDLPARRDQQEVTGRYQVDFGVCVRPIVRGHSSNDVNNIIEFIEVPMAHARTRT